MPASLADPLGPFALGGSPGQAFASHKARAVGIAKFFAGTRPLDAISGQADEDTTTTLLAHLHAASYDPVFIVANQSEPSLTAAPKALRRLERGTGLVGSPLASTKRDYDMALKGLMVLAYRYPRLLGDDEVNFILDQLVPAGISGGHPADIEIVKITFLNIKIPETENHLLMIESSRYLTNQLLHDRTGDASHDNSAHGLTAWLLGFMQTIAQHDFLEFNARPYARLALHPLYNLYEFAREESIRTAARILIDYTMVKFAASSNRGRRVSPFRRQQFRVNHQANERNDLYDQFGDQVAGFFLASIGYVDAEGNPARFPEGLTYPAVIAGTSTYRPPPAAYIMALDRNNGASLHRFFHGVRPQLPSSPDTPESGLEIYYNSPSFLLTAGGSFLNSGYGNDEIDIGAHKKWEQTSRAQATTLIPTRADTKFHDLIRFESAPDPIIDPALIDSADGDNLHTTAVNIGVHRGLAAGANLRPAEKKTVVEQTTPKPPALASHADGMMVAWKGKGDDDLNVARVQFTSLFRIDGVEGIEGKAILGERSDEAPALASHDGGLFLAWKGSGNNLLNIAVSQDGGATFKGKVQLSERSETSPAVASHAGALFYAWTGLGDGNLNVAQVRVIGNTAGGLGIEDLEGKVTFGDTSSAAPAIASHGGRLFLAWKGSDNDSLNVMFSNDGTTLGGKITLDEKSSEGPTLISHGDRLFLGWKGSNKILNVAKLTLFGNTAGGFGIEGVEDKIELAETSDVAPALGSQGGLMFLAWAGEGEKNLNFRISRDGRFQPPGPWSFCNLAPLGFFVAAYRAPASNTDDFDHPPDNLALVYAMETLPAESGEMDFDTFKQLTLTRNNLPASIAHGSRLEFHAADDKRFSILFQLTGSKFQARVLDLNDPNAVSDLSTLPLVSGEYMNAPGGHSGVIEIRGPGQDEATPALRLDFSDPKNPKVLDNDQTWSQPFEDRARALIAFALHQLALDPTQPQAAADALRGFQPPRDVAAEFQTVLGEALLSWVQQLIGAARGEQAGAIGLQAVEAFRDAAGQSGADAPRVARDLSNLSGQLANAHRTAEAAAAQQAMVDILAPFTPPAADLLDDLILLAEGRHTLIVRLIEDARVEQAAAITDQAIADYRRYVGQPGADAPRAARDLSNLSGQLANAHRTAEAAAAQQAMVDILAPFTPPAADLLDDLILLAEGRHTLIVRLIEDARVEQAAAITDQAIADYRRYAGQPGADAPRAARDLSNLSGQLANAHRTAEAAAAQQAMVDILAPFTPPAADLLDDLILLAEGRHTLIVRLIEDARVEQAAAITDQAIADYRRYVGQPGADAPRAARDLSNLSEQLANAHRTAEAAAAQQAMVDILAPFTPPAADLLDDLILLAEGRHTLIVRLIEDARVEQAAAITDQAIADYRRYAGQPGADAPRAARDLSNLSGQLANAHRTAEAAAAQQAMVDILAPFTPPAADLLDDLILLAEGRHTLIVRLIEDARVEQAAAITDQAIADYRRYAGQPGADAPRAARDLSNLSGQLANAHRTAEAAAAQQAMVDILAPFTPPAADLLDDLILLAEGRHTLIVRLIEDARVEQAAAITDQAIADYRRYAGQPGADAPRAARDLSNLSGQLANAHRTAEAAAAQQAMVDILAAFTPPAADLLDDLILLAEGRHTLIVRLIEDARVEQAAAITDQAIADYRRYAGQPGADAPRAARDLSNLSGQLANAHRTAEAAAAQQAMVDILAPFTPPAADLLDDLILLAEGRHTLIVRLIEDARVEQAAAITDQAIADYRRYAGQPGADAPRAARDLSNLSGQLANAHRTAEAAAAQQAMVDILAPFTPPAADLLDDLILLAEGRHTLIVRLIEDARVEQAAAITDQAIADYRRYAGQPGADAPRAARDLSNLSGQLANAHRTAEAAAAQQAMVEITSG